MSFAYTGLAVSSGVLFGLVILFTFEMHRGERVLERYRKHADFFIIKVVYAFHSFTRKVWRDYIQQIAHYIFHTLLKHLLNGLRRGEEGIKTAMKVNRALARNAERESFERSHLEEIALHKAKVALSEKEKEVRKRKTLEG